MKWSHTRKSHITVYFPVNFWTNITIAKNKKHQTRIITINKNPIVATFYCKQNCLIFLLNPIKSCQARKKTKITPIILTASTLCLSEGFLTCKVICWLALGLKQKRAASLKRTKKTWNTLNKSVVQSETVYISWA